ncbi:MAG: preprotein translocase subunit SecG [Alphaproteobacteria bacterium]
MEKIILVIHVLSAVALVSIILLQKSEGGALSGLGGGGNPTAGMFSAKGTATALTRVTAIIAVVFMGSALMMASISNKSNSQTILDKVQEPLVQQEGEVPLTE